MFGMLAPTHELRAVNGHWREKIYVQEHMCKLKIKQKGKKKECKTNNSHKKKKTGKAKHGAFPKVQDHECKLRDLIKGSNK